jgi:hypothetical protein
MRDNPERWAWVVLLTSFFVCIGLAAAVPLGIRHYILHARVRQSATVEVQRGPLRVTLAGRGEPVAIDEERDDIPERTIIATDATAGRLVMRAPQEDNPVVATVQAYHDTEIMLSSARSPRFPVSHLPHQVALETRAGRVRINVSNDDGRPTVVEVQTPHGTTTLTKGSYEVKVNGTTMEVTVRDGKAEVTNNTGHAMQLGPSERAIVDSSNDGHVAGPLSAARNIIVNGDFQVSLQSGWDSYSEQSDPQQPPLL